MEPKNLGAWIAIGAEIRVAIDAALDNIGMGIASGAALGIARAIAVGDSTRADVRRKE
jgi:hypothetical protein